ncbi:MAG: N-6 DNA methylase, partial [Promethearchaeota archaeon]
MTDWKTYFEYIKSHQGTEMTFRTALENLLNAMKPTERINIIHEPHREVGFGAPDFRVRLGDALIGYIETKKLGENLDEIRKSEQIKRYLSLCPNIVITNYSEFILIKDNEVIERVNLFYLSDIEKKRSKLNEENIKKASSLFANFFASLPMQIGKPKDFAVFLAERTKVLKEYIGEQLNEEGGFAKSLKALKSKFDETLIKNISDDEFTDAYAQTVAYGLFLARLNLTKKGNQKIELYSADHFIPNSVPVLQEFFKLISDREADMPHYVKWALNEIIELVNNADIGELGSSLSFRNREKANERDPYTYFYENFLGEFDPNKRKAKGVYYTPPEVVSFIVRSTNKILESEFNKQNGFLDNSVVVLDFACGTGTFLVIIFEEMLEKLKLRGEEKQLAGLVRDHFLKNFYGFEYLIAPYAVAHLKLSQVLADNGYKLSGNERLQIYLTNTLDNAPHKYDDLYPYLSREGKEAKEIKERKPVLVVTGNPPYSVHSSNKTPHIELLMNDYKKAVKSERNIQPLSDDYIKFIRFAQWKIDQNGKGVVAIITNNSYLGGIIHRGMREQLLESFDDIYILNLHGDSRKGEKSPDGSSDENVFDIMQGVSIAIFVKKPSVSSADISLVKGDRATASVPLNKGDVLTQSGQGVFYFDLYGVREKKNKFLMENDIDSVNWQKLSMKAPNFWFAPKDLANEEEYMKGWNITDIFEIYNSGVQTKRDNLFIDYKKDELNKRISILFSHNYDENFKRNYNIKDSSSYNLLDRISKNRFNNENVKYYHYRPFDIRNIYYDKNLLGRSFFRVMRHFL